MQPPLTVPHPPPEAPPLPRRRAPLPERRAGGPSAALDGHRARALPPLDLKLLADLPSLSLRSRCLVDGFLGGRHHSPQKGSSVEFADYRDYQLGDDLRRVDWRLFGRSDRLHVRQYEDEAQLRVYGVLDVSASMDFRSRPSAMNKIEFARLAVAGIASLAQRQGDAFGLGVVGAELVDFLRARSSAAHWQTFIGHLEQVKPQRQTALGRTLEAFAQLIPPRSLVVVASDFYEDLSALESALKRLHYGGHDLIGLQVLDPVEVEFDQAQGGEWVDAETGARLGLESAAVRAGYLDRFRRFCVELEERFRAVGGDFIPLRTDAPPVAALAGYLAKREHRI
ncbi:MAG: DUF58 domain-containing protein [Verrucomicrobia bacterium]|jgi:uncharacterized protein (DUF58 family)|nr:DUF58 domain-containing protein [Verrucomicrobiota bacterium]